MERDRIARDLKSEDTKAYCQEGLVVRRNDDPETWTTVVEATAETDVRVATVKKVPTLVASSCDGENVTTVTKG